MRSLSKKCENCRFAMTLSINPHIEEWRTGERWVSCGFILAFGTRRPCPAGMCCTMFQHRSQSKRTFWHGLKTGTSHYGLYQLEEKGKNGSPYTPKPGDVLTIAASGKQEIGDLHRRIIYSVDNGCLRYYFGFPHRPARHAIIKLSDRRIVGYTTPTADTQDALTRVATHQQMLGVPPSGIFTSEVQTAILQKLEKNGPTNDIWKTFLGCLGYTPNETARFQSMEELPITGVADTASWNRAYQYLTHTLEDDEYADDMDTRGTGGNAPGGC